MAARFWIGGTGNWDAVTTTHWSTLSGGSGGASVPTTTDDVTFDGASGGGTVTMTTAPNILSLTFGAFTGTINDGGKNPTIGTVNGSGAGTRTLTMTGSWTVTASSTTAWNFTTVTGFTYTGTGSTITFTGTSVTIASGGKTLGAIIYTGGSTDAAPHNPGVLTAASLTFNAPSGGLCVLQPNTTILSGNLTLSGAAQNDRLWFRSAATTTQRTITVGGTVSLTNVDFQGIKSAGAAGTWTGTSLGNCGNNSGITFTTPVTRYWVGDTGNFSDALNHIAATSNGSPAAAKFPLPHDTLILDSNSFSTTGKTITFDTPFRLPSLDASLAGTTFTWAFSKVAYFFGNFINYPGTTITGSFAHIFNSLGANILDLQGTPMVTTLTVDVPTGGTGITLASDWVMTNASSLLTLTSGTIDAATYNVTCGRVAISGTIARTFRMGTGTWTLTIPSSASNAWSAATTTNLTFDAGTSTILYSGTPVTSAIFLFGGLTYNNMTFSPGGVAGSVSITSGGTFNIFKSTTSRPINITAGQTITMTTGAGFQAVGTAGNLCTFASLTPGSAWNLVVATGYVSCEYLSLKDSAASGGAAFFAGDNSTNVSGNTGWNFRRAYFADRRLAFI